MSCILPLSDDEYPNGLIVETYWDHEMVTSFFKSLEKKKKRNKKK